MPGRTDSRRRLLFVLGVVVLIAGAAVVRTAQWQVLERGRLVALAHAQTTVRVEERMQRGTIYDRTGTVVLATTVDRDRLVGSPAQLRPAERWPSPTSSSRSSGSPAPGPGCATASPPMTTTSSSAAVSSGGLRPVRDALAVGAIAGVSLEPEPVRVYPQAGGGKSSSLGANLLGFVNSDGDGQYGVEEHYQDALAGSPRILLTQRDVASRPMWDTAQVQEPGVPGSDLRLTIDASLQLRLEQELFAAWVADRAKSVSAVVLDPYTGEVLAEATYPSYDGNEYRAIATKDPSLFLDPVVSAVYEPGSVAKMFLASAAYERKVVTAKTRVNDSGVLKVGGGRVYDADHRAMGNITFEDRGPAGTSACRGSRSGSGRRSGHRRRALRRMVEVWPRRKTGIGVAGELSARERPGAAAVDGARPRQRRVRAGRRGDADPARRRVCGDGERRLQVTPRVVASVGSARCPAAQGADHQLVALGAARLARVTSSWASSTTA
jgi:hypothetical protein